MWEAARQALGSGGDDGEGVVVVIGRPSLAEDGRSVASAAAALAEAWPAARFLPALRRGNVMGALDMGMAPGVLPGRVGLDEGRAWFEAAWGTVPTATGRDATSMLRALSEGAMRAVVLVGADPVQDFPDRQLAEAALANAEFVVAVDAFLSPSAALADVVLPATMAHERAGTTTNIEGRITRLGQKLVAPGQCWPDWMIAAELAERMSGGLGLSSIAEIWDEVERLAPSHVGITRRVLDDPAARDGVVAPLAASPVRITMRRALPPFDPMGTPGIDAVEAQGAPTRAGLTVLGTGVPDPVVTGNGAGSNGNSTGTGEGADATRPARLAWPQTVEAPVVPSPDSYSLRLVSRRALYDTGVQLEASPALAPLASAAVVRVHPAELGTLGVGDGDRVRVRSGRGALVLEARADEGVLRGVAVIRFNLDAEPMAGDEDSGAGASALIDADQAVVDVRLETL